jgi:hypothetical protein
MFAVGTAIVHLDLHISRWSNLPEAAKSICPFQAGCQFAVVTIVVTYIVRHIQFAMATLLFILANISC